MKHNLLNPLKLFQFTRRTTSLLLVIAFMAIALVGTAVLAKDTGASGSKPNVVLVHGAWADGSGWNQVIQRLQQKNYDVTAVQLPLSSLADDVARLRAVLVEQDGPTIVVAHSYGGAVITQLGADAPNVVALIYIAAFAPDEGESMLDLVGHATPTPGLGAIHPDSTGYLWLETEGFVQHFASQVPALQAHVLAAGQKPINSAIFGEVIGPTSWSMLPTWYLVAQNDQVIHPNDQQFFAQRIGATVSTVPSGHLPMISHPSRVFNLIDGVATQFQN